MANSQPRKVLVIDDEPEVVDLISGVLRVHNYEAIATTQWTEALDILAREQLDLVTLDLNMPTIDGAALLKFMRQHDSQVPVMVVSGCITDDIEQQLAPFDVCAYVAKPFDIQHLATEVARILGDDEPEDKRDEVQEAVTKNKASVGTTEKETTPASTPPAPESETPSHASENLPSPGVLPPRRRHRSGRTRKPMEPLQGPLLNRIFQHRTAPYILIALICMVLAGFVVVMADRSNELSSQFVNPPAEVR